MREIVIHVYCDSCLGQGHTNIVAEDEATHIQLVFPDGIREMDLCPECKTDYVSISRADVEAKSAKPKKKKGDSPWHFTQHYDFDTAEESWTCGYCNQASATEQGVKQHLSRQHKDRLPA